MGGDVSYDIYIGEAELLDTSDALDIRVARRTHPEAPTFPGDLMTGNGNSRHPGYSQWAEFADRVGLYDLWFGPSGLLHRHPGCRRLTRAHLDAVLRAIGRHTEKHGIVEPGWCLCAECGHGRDGVAHDPRFQTTASGDRARLLWLAWWMTWALANCAKPSVSNT